MEAEFRKASQERTRDVVTLRNPLRTYSSASGGGKMVSAVNRRGNPLDQLANRSFGPSQLLSSASRNPFQTSTDELVPEGQPLYNSPHVINRVIEPLGPTLDSVVAFELVLLHRKDLHRMDYVRAHQLNGNRERPVVEVNPATFNWQICEDQIEMYTKNHHEYAKLTAQDLWSERWSIDGVLTENAEVAPPGMGNTSGILGARKRGAVISKGPQFIYNYWRNAANPVEPGVRLYAIIKKHAKPEQYVLNNRFNTTTGRLGPAASMRESSIMENSDKMPIRPFLMSFYATRLAESRPPLEELEYVDEYGLRGYGMAILIGVAMHVPREQTVFMASGRDGHRGRDEPFTDSNVGIDSSQLTMLKVMMDCDDGIMPV